jgi:transcription antitermination factor NusA-like protein
MTLKTPICSFDAKTGVLCGRCEERLRSNNLTKEEVHASLTLTKLIQRHPEVDKFSLVTAFKVDDDFVLVLRGTDLLIIRSHSGIRADIEAIFNTRVWFVESESSERRFVENLLYPGRVLSVNLMWLPDGKKLTRVILETKEISSSQNDFPKIQKIAKKIKDIELLVEYKNR